MEDEEESVVIPSLPSNYVSILQLRERWLKEKERTEKKEEEQKQPERQVRKQNAQRRKPEEKKHDRKSEVGKPVVQKRGLDTNSFCQNGNVQFQRNHRAVPASNPRNVNERCTNTEAEGEPLLADPRIEGDEKKNKSKRKGRKKNPRAPSGERGTASRTSEENLEGVIRETTCELEVHDGKKNVRARRIHEKEGMWSQCDLEKAGNMNEMKEMENKFSRISVSCEIKGGRGNSSMRVYRGCSQGNWNFRDHQNRQNFHRRFPHKQRDVGMIWVRKDELSNGTSS